MTGTLLTLDNDTGIIHDANGIASNSVGIVPLRKGIAGNTARVMLTPAQMRAARALLRWSQAELARRCGGVGQLATIKRYESERSDAKGSTLHAWRRTLSKAGVEFIDGDEQRGPGVRLREPQR
jgi:hypothetical protein